MPAVARTVLLLVLSNVFMTFAWYAHLQLELGRLKIIEEVITLGVFVPFAVFYMREPVRDELPLGWALPDGGGVLHVPAVSKQASPGARLARVWGKPYSQAVAP